MNIETYEVEEIKSSDASTMAADAEAMELIEQEAMTPKEKKRLLNDLLIAGELASNICFNYGQVSGGWEKDKEAVKEVKARLREAQERWDCAYSAFWKAHRK